jgi:16S rRNA (guanine966-N2)-methyltransferase
MARNQSHLRIIGGTLGGRKILAPPGLDTRPLPDRIKQSLFDWLGQDLSGLQVADICAGSGAFGIEAYSRGATRVHLIEAGPHALPTIVKNLKALGSPAACTVHGDEFQKILPTLRDLDLIFADPPFPWFADEPQTLSELLRLAMASLQPQGELVIRGERGQSLPVLPNGLLLSERREFARSWIGRYQLRTPA